MATQEGLKVQLESERVRLARELVALAGEERAGGEPERSHYATHLADDATETFDQERSLALARHLQGVLGQIEHALQKMDSGSYGLCDRCGEPIAAARLEALPQATLCLACQVKSEARQ